MNDMRILTIADMESRYYYDYYQAGRLAGFDLILACGDLRREYLEFLVTMASCPLFYVHGNHDESFVKTPPEGCVCIEDRVVYYEGVRFLGLGGSYRYRQGTYMYTERQMARRVRRVWPSIVRNGGFDVLATHAPARHLGDFESMAHRGFECFTGLIDRYQPQYFVHGHIHRSYGMNIPQRFQRGETTIVNAYEHCIIEL